MHTNACATNRGQLVEPPSCTGLPWLAAPCHWSRRHLGSLGAPAFVHTGRPGLCNCFGWWCSCVCSHWGQGCSGCDCTVTAAAAAAAGGGVQFFPRWQAGKGHLRQLPVELCRWLAIARLRPPGQFPQSVVLLPKRSVGGEATGPHATTPTWLTVSGVIALDLPAPVDPIYEDLCATAAEKEPSGGPQGRRAATATHCRCCRLPLWCSCFCTRRWRGGATMGLRCVGCFKKGSVGYVTEAAEVAEGGAR